ncbi:head completion/stabilization protein [Edwardsiella tarda]|uniref:Head completion/stabilization protein n=2 Tax=Edwardsiella TaxID=635 RepID=A0ABN4T2G8_9GAMM|nr:MULTISPECIES: head completion/stabilization protein [Edwardsiella]AKH88165.1 head completion/stabilization protein [Edwardsiella tarda]AOV98011.1 head completion/stabilization protein [Edwardsiella hoshinae]EFE24663.1 phage head completion protein (GPL) [Edwardsiella tarda ATCC 23685]ELM3658172.1 head completion/stabilization protein [Edwardsiella piscicida]UCQ41615.1 head completion/stabilization protein [Edwardsiella piscicida]
MTTVIIDQSGMPAGDAVIIPPDSQREPVIKNTFFFPDVEPRRIRDLMRLEYTVTPARMRDAICAGIAEVNAELVEFRERQMLLGFKTLDAVPAETIDGESVCCFHYLRAVSAMTAASLYERYRGYDASGKGEKKAESVEAVIDELWRDMRWSVSRLQGRPRCIVSQL